MIEEQLTQINIIAKSISEADNDKIIYYALHGIDTTLLSKIRSMIDTILDVREGESE